MYSLYGHLRYFKFKWKYQQYRPCFQIIFPFLMTWSKSIISWLISSISLNMALSWANSFFMVTSFWCEYNRTSISLDVLMNLDTRFAVFRQEFPFYIPFPCQSSFSDIYLYCHLELHILRTVSKHLLLGLIDNPPTDKRLGLKCRHTKNTNLRIG